MTIDRIMDRIFSEFASIKCVAAEMRISTADLRKQVKREERRLRKLGHWRTPWEKGFHQKQLDLQFADVRSKFFSKWDQAREWKAEYACATKRHNVTGYCNSKTKRVYLNIQDFAPAILNANKDHVAWCRAFLIHETLHDVASEHHDLKWIRGMLSAARLAASTGEVETSEYLRSVAIGYLTSFVCGKADGPRPSRQQQATARRLLRRLTSQIEKCDE